ncbi:MAG: oxidoreductase [Bacteroidetes bacterium]|nr:oxidoreductase [Bacteroidota bacterium]
MKIGIIGSGRMGGTLGKLWAACGHEIMFSSRNPQSSAIQELLKAAGKNAQSGLVKEAVQFSDVLLLALPPEAVDPFLEEIGDLNNKILINATNRRDGKSAGTEVIRLAKNGRVIRAFNLVPWEILSKPKYQETNASIFIIGDDSEAKEVVSKLCKDINFDPVDAGKSENIVPLETAMGLLWKVFSPNFGRDYSFRILRRNQGI